jgi:hypothetical protein
LNLATGNAHNKPPAWLGSVLPNYSVPEADDVATAVTADACRLIGCGGSAPIAVPAMLFQEARPYLVTRIARHLSAALGDAVVSVTYVAAPNDVAGDPEPSTGAVAIDDYSESAFGDAIVTLGSVDPRITDAVHFHHHSGHSRSAILEKGSINGHPVRFGTMHLDNGTSDAIVSGRLFDAGKVVTMLNVDPQAPTVFGADFNEPFDDSVVAHRIRFGGAYQTDASTHWTSDNSIIDYFFDQGLLRGLPGGLGTNMTYPDDITGWSVNGQPLNYYLDHLRVATRLAVA